MSDVYDDDLPFDDLPETGSSDHLIEADPYTDLSKASVAEQFLDTLIPVINKLNIFEIATVKPVHKHTATPFEHRSYFPIDIVFDNMMSLGINFQAIGSFEAYVDEVPEVYYIFGKNDIFNYTLTDNKRIFRSRLEYGHIIKIDLRPDYTTPDAFSAVTVYMDNGKSFGIYPDVTDPYGCGIVWSNDATETIEKIKKLPDGD